MLGQRVTPDRTGRSPLRDSGGGGQILDGETSPPEDLLTQPRHDATGLVGEAGETCDASHPTPGHQTGGEPAAGGEAALEAPFGVGHPGYLGEEAPHRVEHRAQRGTVVGPLQSALGYGLAGVLAEAPPRLPHGGHIGEFPA